MRGRPEKRVGGGGYGYNRNQTNDERKARIFKSVSNDTKKKKNFSR